MHDKLRAIAFEEPLSGELADDAAEIANNATRELADMRISRGIEGPKP